MVDIEPSVMVEWVTDVTEPVSEAERTLFARIYPDFVRNVTAQFDRFEQLAFVMEPDGTMTACAGSR